MGERENKNDVNLSIHAVEVDLLFVHRACTIYFLWKLKRELQLLEI